VACYQLKNCFKNEGTTLLELVIAMTLFSITIFSIVPASKLLLSTQKKLHTIRTEYSTLLRTKQVLQEAFSSLDTHRLALPPRIHTGGITYADDRTTPLAIRQDSLGPTTSHAITTVSLERENAMWLNETPFVMRGESNNYIATLRICPNRVQPSTVRSFLLISADMMYEARIKTYEVKEGCAQIEVIIEKSMITANILEDGRALLLVRCVIPIKTIHTLYVSRQGILRLVSHTGSVTLENQPVIDGVKNLFLKISKNIEPNIYTLNATVTARTGRTEIFLFTHSLARSDIFNALTAMSLATRL
jgi:type II secretory pathway pseudopilin PulG